MNIILDVQYTFLLTRDGKKVLILCGLVCTVPPLSTKVSCDAEVDFHLGKHNWTLVPIKSNSITKLKGRVERQGSK